MITWVKLFRFLDEQGLMKYLSDETYLRLMFRLSMGKKLNLESPTTFNEKLQWLKINDRRPEYTIMVDKYRVRDYISHSIGEQYLIPLLGVWDGPEEIDFNSLPNQFVLKCNHNSGLGMCICKDKNKLNFDIARAELKKGLEQDYYSLGREWPYRDVPRKIICEKYMTDNEGKSDSLTDYKFFCFNGQVKFFKIDFDRFIEHHANYYSPNGELMPFGELDYPPKPDRVLSLPYNLKEMIRLSEVLSRDHRFLRVDFYEIDNKIYFGELTFFPASGMGKFTPSEWDIKLGEWLKL